MNGVLGADHVSSVARDRHHHATLPLCGADSVHLDDSIYTIGLGFSSTYHLLECGKADGEYAAVVGRAWAA
jgi:hypothetical protein